MAKGDVGVKRSVWPSGLDLTTKFAPTDPPPPFLLTMAMTALGMGTRFAKFKGLGLAPVYTAGTMFIWLVVGGFVITQFVVATF